MHPECWQNYQLVRSIGSGVFRLNISVALALEYEDVLKRRDMLRGGMAAESIDHLLDYLFTTANLVPYVLRRRPALRDPDDERILEVAVQCRAMIVTHNTKHFVGAERHGVPIGTPAEFLKMLREDL